MHDDPVPTTHWGPVNSRQGIKNKQHKKSDENSSALVVHPSFPLSPVSEAVRRLKQ